MISLCISVALAGCATLPPPAAQQQTPPADPVRALQECQAQVEVLKRRLAKVTDIERNSAPKDH